MYLLAIVMKQTLCVELKFFCATKSNKLGRVIRVSARHDSQKKFKPSEAVSCASADTKTTY